MSRKKLLAILLSASMLLSLTPIGVGAQVEGADVVGSELELNEELPSVESPIIEPIEESEKPIVTPEPTEKAEVDVEEALSNVSLMSEDGEEITPTTISAAREDVDGTEVTVAGVVSRRVGNYWYIQDTESGIAITTDVDISSGDTIKLTGTLLTDDGIKAINASSLEILSDGESAPAPKEVTISEIYAGKYQGMLVSIIGSKIVSMDSENITIRDNDDVTVIRIAYNTELNPGIMVNSKIDVSAIATAQSNSFILKPEIKDDITVSSVPLEISTEEELDSVRNNMYANYILTEDIALTKYWVPIGNNDNRFYGSFDGNNHTISNMDIQLDLEYWYQYAGFMGYMSSGSKISNLTIVGKDGGSIKASTQSGSTYSGGIVGRIESGEITNCYYVGVIESANYGGGIVGYANNSTIKDCVDATVNITSGVKYAGGIAGALYGSISNCTVSGEIKSTGYSGGVIGFGTVVASNSSSCVNLNSNDNVGGFIGYSEASEFTDCYSTGKISGNDYIGGFVGEIYNGESVFTSCYSTSNVTGNNYAGGFLGFSDTNSRAVITYCYALGIVTAIGSVGGFAGYLRGAYTIKSSYSTGSVYASGDNAGGFVGYTENYYYRQNEFLISECYSTANVKGENYVGGFVGKYSVYSDGYIGNIINSYAKDGKIVGSNNVGGFTGYQQQSNNIKYCYADNIVSMVNISGSFASTYENTNRIFRTYYNKDRSPLSKDSFSVGKTNEQLKIQATYLDWDFVNTWEINADTNDGKPYLKSLKGSVEAPAVPIEIASESELDSVRYNKFGHYKLVGNIELTNNWLPIDEFYGVLDGNGYTISNLVLASNDEYVYTYGGLFGYLRLGSEVKNLSVFGNVTNSNYLTGIIAGRSEGYITNCNTSGSVNCDFACGGLVGENYFIISDSASSADVISKGSNSGGLIGQSINANTFNCSSSGNVSGNVNCLGGFVGYSQNSAFLLCSSKGAVSGINSIGGFVGAINNGESIFTSCHSTGDVRGTDNVGGFLGLSDYNSRANITNCSAAGIVTANSSVGGFAGYLYSAYTIKSSYSTGSVYASGDNAGGFVGFTKNCYYSQNECLISECYSTANVKGENYVGGFIGYYSVQYDSNIGNIINSYAKDGKIVGSNNVGGFVGYQYRANYIKYCYSANFVTSIYNSNGFCYSVNDKNKFTRCYFDNERSPLSESVAVGKTSAQLKESATYLDWDFAGVWATSSDKNDGYPYLKSVVEGNGDEEEYTLITNEQELINIRYNLEGKFKLANDITLNYNWVPIGSGTMEKTFDGILDGNGYTIYSFNVPCDEEYEFQYAGMFASIGSKAIVKSLNIVSRENGGVATKNFGSTNKYAAGIAAINYGTIQNCSFIGNISGEYTTGGIAADNFHTIEDCTFKGTIKSTATAGGIVGYNAGRLTTSDFEGTISSSGLLGGIAGENINSVNECTVNNSTITGKYYTGGIVGQSSDNILNSTVVNTTITSSGERTGGIVGSVESNMTISNCKTNSCTVDGTSYTGGIIGYSYNNILRDCAFDGAVLGVDYVGGVIGYAQKAALYNCAANANIDAATNIGGIIGRVYREVSVSDSNTSGHITGNSYVGGAIGYVENYTNGTIARSYSTADINAKINTSGDYFGGFIGYNTKMTVSECYATGNVTGFAGYNNYVGGLIGRNDYSVNKVYATGTVSGNARVGGLIGHNASSVRQGYALGSVVGSNYVGGLIGYNGSTVQFTYSLGRVLTEGTWGGLVGYNANSVLNSYYNKETSGGTDTGRGIPKTTFEMKQQMNYISWNYDTVWSRNDGLNNGYPYLQAVKPQTTGEIVPVEIRTEDELRSIAYNLNGDYKLMCDIALSENWVPLGDFESKFNGNLDGNGFSIKEVSIPGSEKAYVGFFGIIGAGATVKNLTIEISDSGNISAVGSTSFTGGLAGENLGTITNCFIKGDITGQNKVGGLVGENYGFISSCGSAGSVNGISNVGGLIGANLMSVSKSYSTALVTGNTIVGGFMGTSSGTVSSSYATGNTSTRNKGNYVGGFTATNTGTIKNSSSQNNVNGGERNGGFVGDNSGIISNSSSSSVVSGTRYVGGFVGVQSSNTISNCYGACSVNGEDSCTGGFVGYSSGTIISSYSASTISGSTSQRGGFSGYKSGGSITNCYFDSTIAGFTTTNGGTAKNTTSMYTPDTYSNWDFNNTWQFNSDVPGYPYLSWQSCVGEAPSVVPAVSITINAPKTTINVGEAISYTGSVVPVLATDNITWSSSDTNIVTISSKGIVVGMKAGSATITATAGLASATVEVTVLAQQVSGDIISVNSISDIHVPYGSTLRDAEKVLPGAVKVVLNNATLISLPVAWSYTDGSKYSFTGEIGLNDSITNTTNLSAGINVIVDPETMAPSYIQSAGPFEASLSYGTTFNGAFEMLPKSMNVTLADGNSVDLMVSWNTYSIPAFNAYSAGEYEINGTFILPNDGTIVNTNNLSAVATMTVEPMPDIVRNVTSAVYNQPIEVANGTTLQGAKSLLPTSVMVVVDGPLTISVPVIWANTTTPEYNQYKAGNYLFTGTLVMPDGGKITNTLDVNTTINVAVLPSTKDAKNIWVSNAIAEAGNSTDVSVFVDADSKMTFGSVCIAFDNSKATPIDFEIGDVLQNASVMVNMNYVDPETQVRMVKLSFMSQNEIVLGGEMIKLKFLFDKETIDNSEIEISLANAIITDLSETPIPTELKNGTVKVYQILLGDVNGDGKINILDTARVTRFDVGFIGALTDREFLAADVNHDGAVDIVDAVLIQRYDIGLADNFN